MAVIWRTPRPPFPPRTLGCRRCGDPLTRDQVTGGLEAHPRCTYPESGWGPRRREDE